MIRFVARRLLFSIPVIVLTSVIVFGLVASIGDPLAELRLNPRISQQTLELRAKQLNLDKPVMARYAIWARGMVKGDFGRSLVTNEEVRPLLLRRLGVTLRLVLAATILAVITGVTLGVMQAYKQYSTLDYTATTFAFVFFSTPVFFLAAVLKDVGIRINQFLGATVFYTIGEATPNLIGGFFTHLGNRIGHLLLPSLTLILIQMASWSRFQRGGMLEVLNSDYVRTARAKGLPRNRVIFVHAMRNALIPVITIVAIDFGLVIGGAIITESVFAWNGMGRMLLDGLIRRDVNVVQAWLMIIVTMVILFNLLADVLYGYLDPRIRYE